MSQDRRRQRLAGLRATDMMLTAGHPLTCNGGNPSINGHHRYEVLMEWTADDHLICPECHRIQDLSEFDG